MNQLGATGAEADMHFGTFTRPWKGRSSTATHDLREPAESSKRLNTCGEFPHVHLHVHLKDQDSNWILRRICQLVVNCGGQFCEVGDGEIRLGFGGFDGADAGAG